MFFKSNDLAFKSLKSMSILSPMLSCGGAIWQSCRICLSLSRINKIAVLGKMQKLNSLPKPIAYGGSFCHFFCCKPHCVKGNQLSGFVNGCQIAAQHHFIFTDVATVCQKFQIGTVKRKILLLNAQQP